MPVMGKFKAGDRVVCVVEDRFGGVICPVGQEMTVSDGQPSGYVHGTFAGELAGKPFIGSNHCFALAQEVPQSDKVLEWIRERLTQNLDYEAAEELRYLLRECYGLKATVHTRPTVTFEAACA